MPVWHAATKKLVQEGKLVVLGITQEQHPERCALFAQWQGFGWPIVHDPINVLRSEAVPIIVAIDEHGIVRSTRSNPRTFVSQFLHQDFPAPDQATTPRAAQRPDLNALQAKAAQADTADAWRGYGDAIALWQPELISQAIAAYQTCLQHDPEDAAARFRLGVCFRMRYESKQRQPEDFQHAVDAWTAALAQEPNQYIWRRRIQQYGPRLIKPYPFYDWVDRAQQAIRDRGETPVTLPIPPTGAELAKPARRFETKHVASKHPDPNGRITRDDTPFIQAEATVVPAQIKPGATVRVHITLRPVTARKTHWTNDAGPTLVWLSLPEGWQVDRQVQRIDGKQAAASTETRQVEFEVRTAKNASGTVRLPAFALYYVCEDEDGTCRYLRQDVSATVRLTSP